jgi:hypothetical protein
MQRPEGGKQRSCHARFADGVCSSAQAFLGETLAQLYERADVSRLESLLHLGAPYESWRGLHLPRQVDEPDEASFALVQPKYELSLTSTLPVAAWLVRIGSECGAHCRMPCTSARGHP